MQRLRQLVLAGVGAVALWGCKNEKATPASTDLAASDTVAQGVPTMSMVDSAPGALAYRREPEQFFERARTSFTRKQTGTTATALRAASAYFRSVRDSATVSVKGRLGEVDRELDSLARTLDTKGTLTLRALDVAFARANLVEAERHKARLDAAWSKKDTITVAEEMLITVDHLERANKDVAVPLGKSEALRLADARRLGNDLLKHLPLGSAAAMTRVQQDLATVIQQTETHVAAARRRSGS